MPSKLVKGKYGSLFWMAMLPEDHEFQIPILHLREKEPEGDPEKPDDGLPEDLESEDE